MFRTIWNGREEIITCPEISASRERIIVTIVFHEANGGTIIAEHSHRSMRNLKLTPVEEK